MTDDEIREVLRDLRVETRPCPHEGEEDDDCDCPDAVRFAQLDTAIAELERRSLPLIHLHRYSCHGCGATGSMVAYTMDGGEPLCPTCAPRYESGEEWARADADPG